MTIPLYNIDAEHFRRQRNQPKIPVGSQFGFPGEIAALVAGYSDIGPFRNNLYYFACAFKAFPSHHVGSGLDWTGTYNTQPFGSPAWIGSPQGYNGEGYVIRCAANSGYSFSIANVPGYSYPGASWGATTYAGDFTAELSILGWGATPDNTFGTVATKHRLLSGFGASGDAFLRYEYVSGNRYIRLYIAGVVDIRSQVVNDPSNSTPAVWKFHIVRSSTYIGLWVNGNRLSYSSISASAAIPWRNFTIGATSEGARMAIVDFKLVNYAINNVTSAATISLNNSTWGNPNV